MATLDVALWSLIKPWAWPVSENDDLGLGFEFPGLGRSLEAWPIALILAFKVQALSLTLRLQAFGPATAWVF